MISARIGLLTLLISAPLAGECLAQNKGTGTGGSTATPGSKLSPDKEAMLKQMRVGGRYRSAVRRNLQMQQAREDIARAAAEQKAEADRKEALRKAELRRSAADANRSLKDREQDRAERVRKQGDDSATHKPAGTKKPESKATDTGSSKPSTAGDSTEKVAKTTDNKSSK